MNGNTTMMHQAAARQRWFLLLFVSVVTCVYVTALIVVRQLPHLDGARAVSIGLTVDMVILVPLAFYFLVVRRRALSIVSLVPVMVLSLVAASRVLPATQQQFLHVLESLLIPIELALIAWITGRVVKALRRARRDTGADQLEQFRIAAFELMRNDRVAGIFASEIGIFYYAFGSWRSRPHVPAGTSPFTHHSRSGQAGIVFGFILLMAAEGFAVHFLLLTWSVLAAWIFTISTIYGALWLIADYRATVLRPILVSEERIVLRCGLRWTLDVPRAQLIGIGSTKPESKKESLSLVLLGTPTHWITLSEPSMARGPYGIRRRVRTIGIEPDEAEDLQRILVPRTDRRGDAADDISHPR